MVAVLQSRGMYVHMYVCRNVSVRRTGMRVREL